MRYVWITLGVAVLHRLLVFGIAMLGFGMAMTAFNGGSNAPMGLPVMGIAAMLDFPVVLANGVVGRALNGEFPSAEHWSMAAIAPLKNPFWWQAVWSLCVGALVATLVYFSRRKKYGKHPASYWKKGL